MNNDLLQRIQQAQIQAGEDAVVDDLRRKGLLPLAPKTAIAMPLRSYERLVDEFCDEKRPDSSVDDDVLRRLHLGELILWLRKRQETTNEHPNSTTNLRLVTPTD